MGALDNNKNHESQIFALTILLCSCFIYNSVGNIDENAIQNLSLIVNLTNYIQIRTSFQGTDALSEDFSLFFPTF